MKFISATDSKWGIPTIELTRRNIKILLQKLDDPKSTATIENDGYAVTAVEDSEHYSDRQAGEMFMPSTSVWT